MYKALYREYRPEVFEEVIGQEHIIKILRNQVENNTVNHAYLFCGTRGTGKTTIARLMAKAVNCLADENRPCGECENCKAIKNGNFIDLIEIDAASNNGVENIRDLRESVNYAPSIGRKKVYIIDEVHMLSNSAFNAFLKTLEEPPETVMFILATTEPHKLPQTILSRCIRLDFKRVSEKVIQKRMQYICDSKGVDIEEDAIRLLAANADGSVRDGLTLLDQCISGREDKITRNDILESLGAVGEEVYIEIVNAIIDRNISSVIMTIDKILQNGKDPRQVLMGLTEHYRNLMLVKYVKNPEDVLNMSIENVQRIKIQSDKLELEDINDAIVELSKTGVEIVNTTQPRILLELVVVKLATGLTARKLEKKQEEYIRKVDTKANINLKINEIKEVTEDTTVNIKDDIDTNKEINKVYDELEMNELWSSVCDSLAKRRPQISILNTNTKPKKMSEGELVITSSNPVAKKMIEEFKNDLSSSIEELIGRRIHIVVDDEKNISNNDMDLDLTKSKIEDVIGIDLKVID